MKLTTKIGRITFTFENQEDLSKKLEVELVKVKQKLVEYGKLRKEERLISKTIEQLKNAKQQESEKTINS
ncbi:MAG: hypothetical protein V1833_06850 [Elusimicrobiota bacterium]